MKKKSENVKGFAHSGFLLVVVVLLLICGAGYAVYLHNHNNSKTASNSNLNNQTNTESTSSKTAAIALGDANAVLKRQKYIDDYVMADTNNNYTADYYTALFNKGYISSSLNTTIQSLANTDTTGPEDSANPAYDIIVCINQTPSSYTYGTAKINTAANTASLPVNVYISSSSIPTPFTAIWIKSNGVWQLDSSVCSQN